MPTSPRILLYDIENAPMAVWSWTRWPDHGVIDVETDWYLLCVTWKWLGESKVHYCGLDSFPKHFRAHPQDDSRVVRQIHKLFNEADATVAHNNDKFDQRKSNARFLIHGLLPPSPYASVDTYKVAKKHFALSSHNLNDLGKMLQVGEKAKHPGFSMWRGCMQGDPRSWSKLQRYARQDVRLLEKVYKKLLPWIDRHPNYSVYSGLEVCPNCGGDQLQWRGYQFSKTVAYRRFVCQSCGKWSRTRMSRKTDLKAVIV